MSSTVTNILTCPVTLEIISQLTFAPRRQRQKRNSWYTKGPRQYFYLACAPESCQSFHFISALQLPCRSFALHRHRFCFSLLIITNPVFTGFFRPPVLFRESFQLFFCDAFPRSGSAVVLNDY